MARNHSEKRRRTESVQFYVYLSEMEMLDRLARFSDTNRSQILRNAIASLYAKTFSDNPLLDNPPVRVELSGTPQQCQDAWENFQEQFPELQDSDFNPIDFEFE